MRQQTMPLSLGLRQRSLNIHHFVLGFLMINTHRLLSSSLLGLPYRILNTNHKQELLRSLWVYYTGAQNRILMVKAPTESWTTFSKHFRAPDPRL